MKVYYRSVETQQRNKLHVSSNEGQVGSTFSTKLATLFFTRIKSVIHYGLVLFH